VEPVLKGERWDISPLLSMSEKSYENKNKCHHWYLVSEAREESRTNHLIRLAVLFAHHRAAAKLFNTLHLDWD
jgi:hypothetical protein